MKAVLKKEKLWHKDYIIIMLASCGIAFTTFFFLSTLPIYAQKIKGADAYIGFITGAYTISALAVRPFSGIIADRIGRVKILIIGAFICAVACITYQWAASILLLIFLRVVNGIGFGLHSTAAGAVAADVIPKSRLTEGMGYFGLYGAVASATAPAIALSVIAKGRTGNFSMLFIIASGIAVFSMILDSLISYERKRKRLQTATAIEAMQNENNYVPEKNEASEKPPKTILGFEASVLLPALVLLLVFMGQSSVMSFLALYAHETEIGNIGLFFTLLAAGMFVSRLFAGKIGDKHGLNITIIPSMIIVTLSFLAIPFIHHIILLLLLSVPIGLSLGCINPGLNALIFKKCSPSRRGTASAAYFSAIDIGMGAGSILFGFVLAEYGFTSIFIGSFLFSLAALAIYAVFLAREG